jgi:ferrochelatase
MSKKAIVLFNLGGPSDLREVRCFLFNLFYDKAIINMINPFRYIFAKLVSKSREKKAIGIYKKIGGKSPILEQTQAQALKLEEKINKKSLHTYYNVFIAMRYSKPGSEDVVQNIIKGGYEEVVLLPLYPQFSTTTTQSSIEDFLSKVPKSYRGKIKAICCYNMYDNFIKSHVDLIKVTLKDICHKKIMVLFSAHSLPEKIINSGDPYKWQIEQTSSKIMQDKELKSLDYSICYQSKVGPLKWLEPSTENEIIRASKEGFAVVLVPISFVSEHSETLVELDMDYYDLAKENNISGYYRVPTLQIREAFIDSLVEIVETISSKDSKKDIDIFSANANSCPLEYCRCALKNL